MSDWWLSHFVSSRYRCSHSHWFSFCEGFVTYIICDDVLKRHTIRWYIDYFRDAYMNLIKWFNNPPNKNHPKRKHKTIGGVLKHFLFSHLFGEDSDSTHQLEKCAERHFVLHGSWEEDWWSSWRTSHYGLDGTGAGTRHHHHQCSGGAQCVAKVLKVPPNKGWRIFMYSFFFWRCYIVSICFHFVCFFILN